MTSARKPPPLLPDIHWLGDSAVLLDFHHLSQHLEQTRLRVAARCLRARVSSPWQDIVEAPLSLTLHYDPSEGVMSAGTVQHVARQMAHLLMRLPPENASRVIEIPVCYEGPHAVDLQEVATQTGLSTREVIALHASADFEVQSIGFLPGFAYLGGLPDVMRLPRRASPRSRVPAGAVAISERFSGVYPVASPGGWWLLGSTPLSMFKATRQPCSLLTPGDKVRFSPISSTTFDALARPAA